MQMRWLTQGLSSDLIVFFGGWAVGDGVLASMPVTHDVLFVDDYRTVDLNLPDLSHYRETTLIAWSFGVAAYAHWRAEQGQDAHQFTRQIALCGSLDPVSSRRGIPPRIFKTTRDGLSVESYQAFLSNSFGTRQAQTSIDVETRREELDAVVARGAAPDPGFDRIWIASNDKIFPRANLERAWDGQPQMLIPAPHMPFASFEQWDGLWR